jgi:hypothetical protein
LLQDGTWSGSDTLLPVLLLHPQSNVSFRQELASLGELSDLRGLPTLIKKKAFTVSG